MIDGHASLQLKNCPICFLQIDDPTALDPASELAEGLYIAEETAFFSFIKMLMPIDNNFEGCEVLFPDSVFFNEDGTAEFIAKSVDGKLTKVVYPNKMKDLVHIRSKLTTAYRTRQKNTISHFLSNGPQAQNKSQTDNVESLSIQQ